MRARHNALIYRPYKETANVFLVTASISPSVLAVWELHALSPPSAGRYALGETIHSPKLCMASLLTETEMFLIDSKRSSDSTYRVAVPIEDCWSLSNWGPGG